MGDSGTEEPVWLDTPYITKILNKYTENRLKRVVSFHKAPATKKDENYASCMHLVTVSYITETDPEADPEDIKESTFIVKSRLNNEIFSAIEEDFNIFLREAQVYNVIMREAEELLRSVNDDSRFGPKIQIYFATIYLAIYPNILRQYMSLRRYVAKLKDFSEKIIPKMINVFSRSQMDRYHVLNHGDMWVNNMMFRKDASGNVVEVLFVDFQEGFYGSPGIDWNYFIFSSWQKQVFQNNFHELLSIYHASLSELLLKLKYKQRIPTVEDVKKAILNKGFHGLVTATCLMPILINEHSELADANNFISDTDETAANRRKIFDNPKYGERLEVFLEFFENNDIF